MPVGPSKVAAVPTPLAEPGVAALPATVVTTPPGAISRII